MKKTIGIVGSVIGIICSALITFFMLQVILLVFGLFGDGSHNVLAVVLMLALFVAFVFNIVALIASAKNKAKGLVIVSIVFNIVNIGFALWMVFSGSQISLLLVAGFAGAIILQILSLTKQKNPSPVPIKQDCDESSKTESEQTEEIDDKKS